ncbi:MAG: hypothetical protein K2Y32_05280 [Candidatus Obscuribacterales bacterium]|nr:hypothetical protein [Candidatus Obscuribacterales bacterium]
MSHFRSTLNRKPVLGLRFLLAGSHARTRIRNKFCVLLSDEVVARKLQSLCHDAALQTALARTSLYLSLKESAKKFVLSRLAWMGKVNR